MKTEAQRIAIANACGYWGWHFGRCFPPHITTKNADYTTACDAPDYLNDLNAMHEAEKVLSLDNQYRYGNQLYVVVNKDAPDHGTHFLWQATASQRAEAFLKTIGKWEQ